MAATPVMTAAQARVFQRLVPRERRRRRGLAGEGGVSLVLHALVVVLLVAGIARRRLHDSEPQDTVAVVFDGGPAAAAAPARPESRRFDPSSAPDPHAREPAESGQAGAGQAGAARGGQPAVTPPVAASPAAPAPAEPAESAAQAAREATEPAPVAPPRPVVRPRSAAARPAAAARAAASPFGALSAPMDLSLAGHPPPPASAGHLSRGLNLTLAPTEQNRNVMTRYAEARRRLGEDWWAAFSAFVEAHKYYPQRAAQHGDDGQVVLRLVIERDGRVRSVRVDLSSGSPLLDMAWVSEFRDQMVPPFPPGTTDAEISFSASMTYILEHQ